MKVLITGWQGFIGRNVVNQLSSKYTFIRYDGDICHWLPKTFYPDVVLHLAALTGVRTSFQQPEAYWNVNVQASKTIFTWCSKVNVRCIYASSSSVYEWWLNPYATTKKVMETIAPKTTLGMRFHTVYGPDSRPDMFYDRLITQKVTYLTNHLRDFTHINDVVTAIDILLEKYEETGVIDIGTGKPVSVCDVAAGFEPDHGLPIKEVSGERWSTCANINHMRSLGWEPQYNIMDEVKNERERVISVGGKV